MDKEAIKQYLLESGMDDLLVYMEEADYDIVAGLSKRAERKFQETKEACRNSSKAVLPSLLQSKNYNELFSAAQSRSEDGDSLAHTYLGLCYEYGYGTAPDIPRAVEIYRDAAEKGEPMAQFAYSECLFSGKGVPKNIHAAKLWCRKSSLNDYYPASIAITFAYTQRFLELNKKELSDFLNSSDKSGESLFVRGILTLIGRGVVQNTMEGLSLLGQAASTDYPLAIFFKAVDIYLMRPDRFDDYSFDKYFGLIERAAKLHCADAIYTQAELVLNGAGKWIEEEWLEANETKARKLYKKAAELGNEDAMTRLGIFSLFGYHVEASEEEAVKWFEKAIQYEDDPRPFLCLGFMHETGRYYIDGHFCMENQKAAEKLYEKARYIAEEYVDGAIIVDEYLEYLRKYEWIPSRIREKADKERLKEESQQSKFAGYIAGQLVANERLVAYLCSNPDAIKKGEPGQESILLIGLADYLSHEKECLQSQMAYIGGTEQEEKCKAFFEDLTSKLNDALDRCSKHLINEEEEKLRKIFGYLWDELDPYTRRALLSAIILLDRTCDVDIDFSGIVICATTALENELKIRFFDGYKAFLRRQKGYSKDFSKWPKAVKYQKSAHCFVENRNFFLSTMPIIFGGDKREENGDRKPVGFNEQDEQVLDSYLKTIARTRDVSRRSFIERDDHRGGLSIVDRCEDIRVLYRNDAAHTAPMSREDANECCSSIIGVTSDEASKGLKEIQGILLEIAQLTTRPI